MAGVKSLALFIGSLGIACGLSMMKEVNLDKNTKGCTKLPTMLYLGFGHSGSTSLSHQLNEHPQISYGNVKEHHDFSWPVHGGPLRREDLQLYASEFNETPCNKTFTFDATIGNALAHPYDRNRYKEALGQDVKLLFMFRDPVAVLHSILEVEDEGGVRFRLKRGFDCWVKWIQNWLDVFPRKNFLFIKSEDYFQDPQAAINQITDFMGAQRYTYKPDQLQAAGRRRHNGPLEMPELLHYWRDPSHHECAHKLEELLNMSIPWVEAQS